MPSPPQRHGAAMSTFDKWKMGALMGGTVGTILGFLYGTLSIFRYGAGPKGILRTLGQYMGGSGVTFGFFMSIGSVIRSDASPIVEHAYANTRPRPYIVAVHAFHERTRPRGM